MMFVPYDTEKDEWDGTFLPYFDEDAGSIHSIESDCWIQEKLMRM